MLIAVSVTLINIFNPLLIIIGISIGALVGSLIALKVKMTSIPEMVALFNGFGGLATFFIAWSEYNSSIDNFFQYILIMDGKHRLQIVMKLLQMKTLLIIA